MKYQPIITKTAIIIDLEKPIYGSRFGIWDKWLKIAKKRALNIVINTPFGKSTYKYGDYMAGAKLYKRFYKDPNEPMRFYCRDFLPDIREREERKRQEEKESQSWTPEGARNVVEAWRKIENSI